jgi:hypothetical protein
MGYIPSGAKWYIADLVREFKVEGEKEDLGGLILSGI